MSNEALVTPPGFHRMQTFDPELELFGRSPSFREGVIALIATSQISYVTPTTAWVDGHRVELACLDMSNGDELWVMYTDWLTSAFKP